MTPTMIFFFAAYRFGKGGVLRSVKRMKSISFVEMQQMFL